jgi:hypothetical protein
MFRPGQGIVNLMDDRKVTRLRHLDGMREDGIPVPAPSSRVEYVEVAA